MRPILIDTNAYVHFKKGDVTVIEIIRHAESIIMSPIVLAELLAGFEGGNKTKNNKIELLKFLESSRIRTYPITSDTSHYYSLTFSSLKNKGKPIPTNDIWIAAQALEHGCAVCTFDKHFSFIEGLISGNTLTELMI